MQRRPSTAKRLVALPLGLLLLLACQQGDPLGGLRRQPVVQQQTFSAAEGSIDVVAVMPFFPRPELVERLEANITAEEVADLVSSYFSEALANQGVRVIPPNDLVVAFTAQSRATPRRDPRSAAEVAAREFGATAVLLGEVYRWRERQGEAFGADRPASVSFEVSLFEVQAGRRIWRSRFDHTQKTLSGSVFTATQYPGGGARWLTAAEMARWGADHSARSLVEGQWRPSN